MFQRPTQGPRASRCPAARQSQSSWLLRNMSEPRDRPAWPAHIRLSAPPPANGNRAAYANETPPSNGRRGEAWLGNPGLTLPVCMVCVCMCV